MDHPDCAHAIRSAFGYLEVSYGYRIAKEESTNAGYLLEMSSPHRLVSLYHDFRENAFYFKIERIRLPSDSMRNESLDRTTLDLALKYYAVHFDLELVRPDRRTCEEAAQSFGEAVKMYCGPLLRGEEWVLDLIQRRDCPIVIRKAFEFLVSDFGYSIDRDEERSDGYLLVFSNKSRVIKLHHKYLQNKLEFDITRINQETGRASQKKKDTVSFLQVISSYHPGFQAWMLQPNGWNCKEAALLNAELIRESGSEVLRGTEWP